MMDNPTTDHAAAGKAALEKWAADESNFFSEWPTLNEKANEMIMGSAEPIAVALAGALGTKLATLAILSERHGLLIQLAKALLARGFLVGARAGLENKV